MKKLVIKLIQYYQYFSKNIIGANALPLLFQSHCRYYPTCSDYTINSIKEQGVILGTAKGLVRIIKCNPLYK